MQPQREQAESLLAEFAAAVPSLCSHDDSDQLMAGRLLLALELVRSLELHDVSTPGGNLVDVLITGEPPLNSLKRACCVGVQHISQQQWVVWLPRGQCTHHTLSSAFFAVPFLSETLRTQASPSEVSNYVRHLHGGWRPDVPLCVLSRQLRTALTEAPTNADEVQQLTVISRVCVQSSCSLSLAPWPATSPTT